MNAKRVLLCSIDGLRADALAATATPTIDALIAGGASCLSARSVMPSVTLPCHTSMLRGVDVPRHGITSNTFAPLARPVPSLLDAAHGAGKRVGFFYNWEQLRDLSSPGSVDVSVMYNDAHASGSDERLTDAAIAHLSSRDFELTFLYLGHTDEVGHKSGWMSREYLDAASGADACLGRLIDALKTHGVWDDTVTLVLSDHGGHGRSHGTDCHEDMTIPWVLFGPGVKSGETLTGPIFLYDTCPTLAWALGLALDRSWDGRVVREAFA